MSQCIQSFIILNGVGLLRKVFSTQLNIFRRSSSSDHTILCAKTLDKSREISITCLPLLQGILEEVDNTGTNDGSDRRRIEASLQHKQGPTPKEASGPRFYSFPPMGADEKLALSY